MLNASGGAGGKISLPITAKQGMPWTGHQCFSYITGRYPTTRISHPSCCTALLSSVTNIWITSPTRYSISQTWTWTRYLERNLRCFDWCRTLHLNDCFHDTTPADIKSEKASKIQTCKSLSEWAQKLGSLNKVLWTFPPKTILSSHWKEQ